MTEVLTNGADSSWSGYISARRQLQTKVTGSGRRAGRPATPRSGPHRMRSPGPQICDEGNEVGHVLGPLRGHDGMVGEDVGLGAFAPFGGAPANPPYPFR